MAQVSLSELKQAYQDAKDSGKTQFTLKGMDLLVGYAKYLIQYLENIRHLKGSDSFRLRPKKPKDIKR